MAGFDTAFDDLPAVKPMATDGLFDDLPDAPAKRKVGPVEAFGRSMGDSIAAVPDFLNEAAAALLRPVDSAIGSDLSGALTRPTGPVKQARTAYKLNQQTEQLDGAGAQLAQGLGPLPRDLVAAFLTSGLSAPAAATVPSVDAGLAASIKALVPELQHGAKAMMVPGALSSRDAYNEARVAGADPMQAAAVGTVRGVGTVAQGALPMAKAGSVGTRVASGIPLAVLPNRVQLQAENLVAPESMQHQPTPTDDIAAAIPGMVLAGLLGPRARTAQRPADVATDRMRYDARQEQATADAAQLATDLQTYGPILEANGIDPTSTRAQGVIANLKAVAERRARERGEQIPPSPEEVALENRQAPPDVITVEPTGVNGSGINKYGRLIAGRADGGENTEGVMASLLDQGGRAALQDKQAREAFDLADRRQRQADADLANRGQIDPDYQGGGAAARGGEFDAGIRRVTLLDGELPVRLMESDGKKATVALDHNGKEILIEVDPKRITEHDLPANQRMAQDFNARSSEPPSAVGRGTMASENMPRRSTDRIAGDQYGGRATPYDPNPLDGGRVSGEVLPPDAGTSVVPGGRRAGDTVEGTAARPTAGFDAPNEQRQIGAPPRQIGERSRFATDEQGRTVDRENRQPLAGEGRPLERKQTTNDKRTNEQTTQQTGEPLRLPAPKGAADGQVQKAPEEVLRTKSPDESPLMGKESGNPFEDTQTADRAPKPVAPDRVDEPAGFKLDPHGDAELRQRERARAEAGRAERALAAEAAAKEAKAKAEREAADVAAKVKEKAADPENFVFGEDKKAAANPERNLFDQPPTTNPADAKPVAPEVAAKISKSVRNQQGGFIDPNVFGLTKIADAIRNAWDFSFGDAKAHADRLYDISKVLKAVAEKSADFRASPIRHIWEMTLETMQGTQRGIQRRNGSETYKSILDQFSAEAGADRAIGETYDAAVQVHTNQYLNRLQKALDSFQRDDVAMQQIVRRVRSGSFDNSPAGKAAKEVATLLKDAHDYMKAAGVEIGEIKNGYYPREFDKQLAMKNPTGFRDALEFEYRKTMPPADAKLAAQRLADTIMYGDTTTMFKANGGQVRTPWAKERVFSKDVDNASHPLNQFLMADAMDNLTRYLQSAVRRAEVSRRFGDKFFNFSNEWKDAKGQKQKPLLEQLAAEGAQDDIGSLQDFVATMAGLRTSGVSDRWMTASSSLRTWTSLMMLSKATLSSLSEFVTPAIRAAGSTSNPFQLVPDAARMLNWTLADVMHKARSASAKERRAIADDLGLIAGTHSDMMTAARWSGGDDFSKAQSLTLSNFFSRTYLTQWTEHTRVAATEMGRVFIRRIAKQAGEGDKLAARYLREIGVSDANMKGFTEWVGKTNDGMPSVGDFQGAHGTTYRTALHRFVEQSIMVPTKGTKPGWMNSPQGAVIGQLNSFNYAFYENVVKRNMKLAKGALTEKNMTTVERMRMAYPLLSMPALVAVAYAIGEMRDEFLGDPERRKEETTGDKVLKAASRGAPIAPLDPFLNFYTAAKYQRSAAQSFAGPGLGSMLSGMDAARNLTANNKDTTNTEERQAARAVWSTLIEPGLQLGLSAFPVAPAYAIMTQVVGSGGAQAAFVDAVAGEDTRKKKQQRQW